MVGPKNAYACNSPFLWVVVLYYIAMFLLYDLSGSKVTYEVDAASENNPKINNQATLHKALCHLLLHISKGMFNLIHSTGSTCSCDDGFYCSRG
jgi:hypothetical protein